LKNILEKPDILLVVLGIATPLRHLADRLAMTEEWDVELVIVSPVKLRMTASFD